MHIKKKNRSILLIIAIILLVLLCAFCIWLIINTNNTSSRIKEGINQISVNLNEYDEGYTKASDQLDKINNKEIKILDSDSAIGEVNNKINSVSEDYVTKYKVQQLNDNFLNMLIGHVDLSNTDYSIYRTSVSDMENTINTNEEKITEIDESKESTQEKVSDMSVINRELYISNLGLSTEFKNLYNAIYPVGSIYISINGNVPLIGSWQQLQTDTTIWNDSTQLGEFLEATLPNVTGTMGSTIGGYTVEAPFYTSFNNNKKTKMANKNNIGQLYLNLHQANPIYQDDAGVRPPAIGVAIFKRVE